MSHMSIYKTVCDVIFPPLHSVFQYFTPEVQMTAFHSFQARSNSWLSYGDNGGLFHNAIRVWVSAVISMTGRHRENQQNLRWFDPKVIGRFLRAQPLNSQTIHWLTLSEILKSKRKKNRGLICKRFTMRSPLWRSGLRRMCYTVGGQSKNKSHG